MGCPVAYHITFTTYGSWLHGDERSSVDKEHNRYASAFVTPNHRLQSKQYHTLKNPPVVLDETQRQAALEAILQVCDFRDWVPHAVHVRSNHIHIVVSGNAEPEKIMNDFKAYATRAIKGSDDKQKFSRKYWSRHGSTKYLWTRESLASAIDYVKNKQGKIMSLWVRCSN